MQQWKDLHQKHLCHTVSHSASSSQSWPVSATQKRGRLLWRSWGSCQELDEHFTGHQPCGLSLLITLWVYDVTFFSGYEDWKTWLINGGITCSWNPGNVPGILKTGSRGSKKWCLERFSLKNRASEWGKWELSASHSWADDLGVRILGFLLSGL